MDKNKVLIILLILAIVGIFAFAVFRNPATDAVETTEDSVAIHLTDEDFHSTVENSQGVAFVDFWAAWCSPCLQLAPILEEVASEYDVALYKLNVDENPITATEFQITGIPMVYVYKDGQIVDSIMGLGTKQNYVDMVEKYSD